MKLFDRAAQHSFQALACVRSLIFLALGVLLPVATVSSEPNTNRVRVGAILPLSGVVSSWGERVRIGLETANELRGDAFDIRFEDEGACEGQKALSAYRKLVSADKVKIIFVGCLAGTKAIAPVASKDSVVLLSLGLLDEAVLSSGAKLVNLATEIGTEGEYLSKFVARESAKRLAGIFTADAFGQEFARVLAARLQSAGQPLLFRDEAEAESSSFKSIITRWKQAGVELVIASLADKQSAILFREMRTLGFAPTVYSSYVLEAVVPSPEDRVLFEGAKYTHPVNSSEGSSENKAVEAAVRKRQRPGQDSNVNALFAYDGLGFLLDALRHCKGEEVDCIFEYFTALNSQHGVSGTMRFRRSGGLDRPYGLKTVRSGEFVWLKRTADE